MDEGIIDRLYEAAVIPERWKSLSADFSALTDSAFGCLLVASASGLKWIGTPEADEVVSAHHADPDAPPNTRVVRGMLQGHPGFLQDLDIFTEDEIAKDPFYRDFMWPRGYGWCCGTFVTGPAGELIAFNVERRRERGLYERPIIDRLDALRPHLARAATLAARLGLERAKAAAETLKAIGMPAALLSRGGALFAANDAFQGFIPSVALDRPRRLSLANPTADALLGITLDSLARVERRAAMPLSIPIPSSEIAPPAVLHLLPVAGLANDVFSPAATVAMLVPLVLRDGPSQEIVQALFDLSPAEAAVARAVAGGKTLQDLSRERGVSYETLRSHLKSVFSKTGVVRQQELSALLAPIGKMPTG